MVDWTRPSSICLRKYAAVTVFTVSATEKLKPVTFYLSPALLFAVFLHTELALQGNSRKYYFVVYSLFSYTLVSATKQRFAMKVI